MKHGCKKIEDILPTDFEQFPIWEFDLDGETAGDTVVCPIEVLPVDDLANRVIGTTVRLGSSHLIFAILSNIDLCNASSTQQFLTISVFHIGKWLHLARYFDFDYAEKGPKQFAAMLGFSEDQVFPIVYDIRHCCIGQPDVLIGTIEKETTKRLSRSELRSLAAPKRIK